MAQISGLEILPKIYQDFRVLYFVKFLEYWADILILIFPHFLKLARTAMVWAIATILTTITSVVLFKRWWGRRKAAQLHKTEGEAWVSSVSSFHRRVALNKKK